jgi:hypothetical protein
MTRKNLLNELKCEEICVIERKDDSEHIEKEIKKLKDKKNCLC